MHDGDHCRFEQIGQSFIDTRRRGIGDAADGDAIGEEQSAHERSNTAAE